MSYWASADKKPRGGFLGEWVYDPIKKPERFGKEPALSVAATTNPFDIRIGQQVTHRQFGNGVVLQREGQGNITRVQIKFAVGVKWVLSSYVA
jgi:DNA helicase-2/ATP-dependent DNA helicase PcrA